MTQSDLGKTLLETINTIRTDPEKAKVQFKADTELIEGVKCKSRIRQFSFEVDEPGLLGGTDTASNPVELILAALGTCQEIMYSAYASVSGIPIDSISVKVRGDINLNGLFGLDEKADPGFNKIYYETKIHSGADTEVINKLVENVEKHCPVLDILTRPISVVGKVSVIKSAEDKAA